MTKKRTETDDLREKTAAKTWAEEKRATEEYIKKLEESRSAMIYLLKDMERGRKELERAYEELKALDRMKDEFLEMTSHELKTPLTSMNSFTSLLLNKKLGELTDKQQEGLEIISDDIIRLVDSVDKIMDMSRLKSGLVTPDLEDMQLREVIEDAVERMRKVAESKCIKVTQKLAKLPPVRGDRDLLDKVILNLLSNAVKFTPENGQVHIEAGRKNGRIVVRITDTGVGITEENMRKLFTKFFQADHSVPGVGLGLCICKMIVDAHGGEVQAESRAGKGSTFSFILPIK
jgi:signal transduction histidine kinase